MVKKLGGINIDARKHIREEERLNQALGGKLPEFFKDFYEILKNYDIDLMSEMSFDCCKYALEEICLKNIEFPEYSTPNAATTRVGSVELI